MKQNKKLKLVFFSVLLVSVFLAFGIAKAADFNTVPATATVGQNQEFGIDIKINTDGSSVNAVQATLKFSADVLQVKSISKDGSAFNFWLQEPIFSNTDGKIEFIAGTPNGVSGGALQVVRINFVSKGLGTSELIFTDGAISASDGSGTNILSKSNGGSFIVSSTAVAPPPGKTGEVTAPVIPKLITRTPAPAVALPVSPIISIPLYPDPAKWYGFVASFNISWPLPADISGVSTAFDNNPNADPVAKSEGLFDSKTYPSLSKDGVYYFHIRFQNAKGWGKTIHYRIAVDTQPPVPFKFDVASGFSSDDPAPVLTFQTGDSLSGIEKYKIRVDAEEPVFVNGDKNQYKMILHPPGTYMVTINAIDRAGNSIEDKKEVEILPIAMPAITSVSGKIIIGSGEMLRVKGTATPNIKIVLSIIDSSKFLISQNEFFADANGNWTFQLDKELRSGSYIVTAKAKDERGALSLPTNPEKFSFQDKPIISFFGLDITFRTLTIIILIAGILSVAYFWRMFFLHRVKSQMGSVIISRDLKNAIGLVRDAVDKLPNIIKKNFGAQGDNSEINIAVKQVNDQLGKIEKYIYKDIEKLE